MEMGILINMSSVSVGNLIWMLLYLDLVIASIQAQVRIMSQLYGRRFVSLVILATQQGQPRLFFYTQFQNDEPWSQLLNTIWTVALRNLPLP